MFFADARACFGGSRGVRAEGAGRGSRVPHGVVVVVTLTPAEASRGVVALLTLITV